MRWLLKDKNALPDFGRWKHAGSSFLLEVECVRALDRLRIENRIDAGLYADLLAQLNELTRSLELFHIDTRIITQAKSQYIACVKTLDAIHIATAQLWQDELSETVLLISHDQKLNLIAKSLGLKTLESK
jgi:hypothetical protein